MTIMTVQDEQAAGAVEVLRDFRAISDRLATVNVSIERVEAGAALPTGATNDDVLALYREPVDRLTRTFGFKSVDVVGLQPDHPDRAAMRAKFLAEHVHGDFEVRLFVAGRGLFYLHPDSHVYSVLCEQGDLISVPAGTRHWFDMGTAPHFRAVRLFTTPEGWVAEFTGSDIASRFPAFDAFVATYA